MLTRTVLSKTELRRAVTCCSASTIAKKIQQSLKTAALLGNNDTWSHLACDPAIVHQWEILLPAKLPQKEKLPSWV